MAYDIIARLTTSGKQSLLNQLKDEVQKNEASKGKKHQVFRLSCDARKCCDMAMLEQKLDYIHHNPVKGKWRLVDDYCDYKHSSASFYEKSNIKNSYVTHYKEI